MKQRDSKLFYAVLLLIGLMIALIILTLNRNSDIRQLKLQIQEIQRQIPVKGTMGKDGRTPVLGIDYFIQNGKDGAPAPIAKDGRDGHDGLSIPGSNGLSAYDLAIQNGFQGTLAQWLDSLKIKGDNGDPGAALQIGCINNKLSTKYNDDTFWQSTSIKCETTDE